jgi:Zn-dependent protease with chaperone function
VAAVTVAFDGPTAVGAGLAGVFVVERLVAMAVARRLELAADTRAARGTSTEAVVALLEAAPDTGTGRFGRLFSSHPSTRRRIERLQAGTGDTDE